MKKTFYVDFRGALNVEAESEDEAQKKGEDMLADMPGVYGWEIEDVGEDK